MVPDGEVAHETAHLAGGELNVVVLMARIARHHLNAQPGNIYGLFFHTEWMLNSPLKKLKKVSKAARNAVFSLCFTPFPCFPQPHPHL